MGDGVPGRVRSVSSGNGSVSSPGTKKPSPGCRPAVASRKEREWPLPETVSSCPDVLVTWDQATRLTPWTLGPEDTTAWTLQGAPFLVSGSKSSPRHPAIKTFLRDSKEKRRFLSQIHACESDPHHQGHSSPKNGKLCHKLPPRHSDSLSVSKINVESWKIQESAANPRELTSLSSCPEPRNSGCDVLL